MLSSTYFVAVLHPFFHLLPVNRFLHKDAFPNRFHLASRSSTGRRSRKRGGRSCCRRKEKITGRGNLNMKSSINMENNHLPNAEIQNSLRNEILQLEKRLHDQVVVRGALEQALGYKSSSPQITNQASIPMPATELIKYIVVLEYEVSHLEQYLLSLYRKAFDQQIPCPSPLRNNESLKSPLVTPRGKYLETSRADISLKPDNDAKYAIGKEDTVLDSSVHRCHSSLSQHSMMSTEIDTLGKALRACHSQPLSMIEYAQNNSSNIISPAGHLGTRICDHIPETPNNLSEDIIKCMSSIYCKLVDPPLTNQGILSPTSSLSSMSAFSPKDHSDMMWSPGFRRDLSSFDVRLNNPFHVQGLKEFSGPNSTIVEIQCIYRDGEKMGDIEHKLQDFRSLISRLEEVDPRKLKHEEKLAFWINVHNALVMHAVLAYGIPQNNIKSLFAIKVETFYPKPNDHKPKTSPLSWIIDRIWILKPYGSWIMDLSSGLIKEVVKGSAKVVERCGPLILSSGLLINPPVTDNLQAIATQLVQGKQSRNLAVA